MSRKTSLPREEKIKSDKNNKICFTIMPFGEWFDGYYEEIYKPAIIASDMEPIRADDLYRPSSIINDVWNLITISKILLADLTDKNPNVLNELGLAHAIAKPAIIIAEKIEDIPFDLRSLRVIVYNKNDPNWGINLKEKISLSIKEVLASPKESVPPTFLSISKEIINTKVPYLEKEIQELKNDIENIITEIKKSKVPNMDLVDNLSRRKYSIQELINRHYDDIDDGS